MSYAKLASVFALIVFMLLVPLEAFSAGPNEPGSIGRTADGRAFRIDAKGYQLVDHIAQLEVSLDELKRQNQALENEVTALREGGARERKANVRQSDLLGAEEWGASSRTCEDDVAPLQRRIVELRSELDSRESPAVCDYEAVRKPLLAQIEQLSIQPKSSSVDTRQFSRKIQQLQAVEKALREDLKKEILLKEQLALRLKQEREARQQLAANLEERSQQSARLSRNLSEGGEKQQQLAESLEQSRSQQRQIAASLDKSQSRAAQLERSLRQGRDAERELTQRLSTKEQRIADLEQKLAQSTEMEVELGTKVASLERQVVTLEESVDKSLQQYVKTREAERARLSRASTPPPASKQPVPDSLGVDQVMLRAAKKEFRGKLSSIQKRIGERKSLLDRLKRSQKGISIQVQPLVSGSGRSLDSLRQHSKRLGSEADIVQVRSGLRDIEALLVDDIKTLTRLTGRS